ncbi:MAG: hypothetical protein ACQER4_05910 [Bacteroidota bacterium]
MYTTNEVEPMNEEIEILKAIDTYVRGELSIPEADQLWSKLIEREEYMDYLTIEVVLRNKNRGSDPPSGASGSPPTSGQTDD